MNVICKDPVKQPQNTVSTVNIRCSNKNVFIYGIHEVCRIVQQCDAYQELGLNLKATQVGKSATLKCQDGYRLNPSAMQPYRTQGTTVLTIPCTSDDAHNNGFTVIGTLCFKKGKCDRRSIANGYLPETSIDQATAATCNFGFVPTSVTVMCDNDNGWENTNEILCERKCAANGVYPTMKNGEKNRAPVCGNLIPVPDVTIECFRNLFIVLKNGLRYSGPLCKPNQTGELVFLVHAV
ncbi:uncharacterized protein LOC135827147 [Sycon ciliatum]|uniref:uncharacterized protein LOC135827147 n=1 Tax=Sycon ciliatum TaxID=27933 RepID=UPI0031F6B0A6